MSELTEVSPKSAPVKIAVFASGGGSNLKSLISNLDKTIGRIELVISNKKEAFALNIAQEANIKALYVKRNEFSSDDEYDKFIVKILEETGIKLVLLAGYLRILTPVLLKKFEGRIINIHPSLLPDFGGQGMYGIKVHEAVIESKAKKSGCSVHLVNEKIDGGKILAQKSVEVLKTDTPQTLAAKVLAEEHKLFPETVNRFLTEMIKNEKT